MKGKMNWKAYLAGVLTVILVVILAIPVLGASGTLQTWKDVLVGGITIVLDGDVVDPRDANGNPVDPVIYNGTTYLPVRAIATALGKEVAWESSTKTVYLGWRPAENYNWVLTKKSFEVTPTPIKQDVVTYSCEGVLENVVWFRENYRWSSGSEYVNADGYWGCQLPPSSIPAGSTIKLQLSVKVKEFESNAAGSKATAPFDGCYAETSFYPLKAADGSTYLDPNPDADYVTGNLEVDGVFTTTLPESTTVGAEHEVRFYCQAGCYVWTYTLKKN
jgi:hypothetical protein